MADQGWYARARARVTGVPEQRQQPQPYPTGPDPGNGAPQPQPQYGHVQPQYAPQYAPVQPQYQDYNEQVKQGSASLSTLLDVQRATGVAKPGKGSRLNPMPCPECGSSHYYEDLGVSKRGPAPAPRCFDCGYNGGLFTQGLQSSWQ